MSARSRLILIADDDPSLREVVRFALEKEGFAAITAADGKEALALFREKSPALVVLDILMPELDGTEVCRAIRRESDVPIIFLSSKDDELDRVLGLELGGDDYVTKPFSPRELAARVKAVCRRLDKPRATGGADGAAAASAAPKDALRHGALTLDLETFKGVLKGTEVVLTVMEFELLKTLMTTPTKVFTRDELMDRAYDNTVVADRTIDSHIRRVRRKFAALGFDPIETVTGFGYRMGPKP